MKLYCTCKFPQVEEYDEGRYYCTVCANEVEPRHEDAPEPDDFSEAQDIIDVEAMNKGYEDTRNRDFEVIHDCGII